MTGGYEVSRVKIMEFAEAIGDPNPAYRDVAAARRAGYSDVIAPPTFAVVVVLPASIAAAREAFSGTGSLVVVHVEQHFDYSRPIQAGDVLYGESVVTSIRQMRGTVMTETTTQIQTADGEHVCTAAMTLAILSANGNSYQPPHL
jgi:acyl dehydratase